MAKSVGGNNERSDY